MNFEFFGKIFKIWQKVVYNRKVSSLKVHIKYILKFLCLGTCMYFYMYLQGWHFSVVHYFLSNLKKKFQKIQNSWFCLSAANLALFCLWKLLHLKIALKSPNQMFNFHDHNIWPGNNLSSVGTLNIEFRNPSSKVS